METVTVEKPPSLRGQLKQVKAEIESLTERQWVLKDLANQDTSKLLPSELKAALQNKAEAKSELSVTEQALKTLNQRRSEILQELKEERELAEIEQARQRVQEFQATLPEWAERLEAAARTHAEVYAEFAKAAAVANDWARFADPQSAAVYVDFSQGLRTLSDGRVTLIEREQGRWFVRCPRIATWLKDGGK